MDMTRQRARSHFARGLAHSRAHLPAPVALAALIALALGLVLAGCGQAGASGQAPPAGARHTPLASTTTATATGAPASQPTAAGQKAAASAVNECPSAQAPADAASFTPDVIVGMPAQNTSAPQPVMLARGQRVEVRLPPTFSWELSTTGTSGILAGANPQGWYDAGARACVWRFTAQGAGNAQLMFAGAAVCPPLELCPSVEQTITYAVTVR